MGDVCSRLASLRAASGNAHILADNRPSPRLTCFFMRKSMHPEVLLA